MTPLFRLERNPEFDPKRHGGGQLGFDWIEVLAIEPRALGKPEEQGQEGWCWQEVHNWYICRTELGIMRFPAGDIWGAVEDTQELMLAGGPIPVRNLTPAEAMERAKKAKKDQSKRNGR